jgi:hypothetical protein
MYIMIGGGVFRAFYETLKANKQLNPGSIIAALITSVFWPVYWGYQISKMIDPENG